MALIPPNIVAEIRDRTDIVAIVGEYVQLRRAGANHQGLCPFHQEKSPSFSVSAAKQFFYCFGCQKSGDVFRFLMDITGRTFVDIATELAGRAGVMIPEPEVGRGRLSPEERAQASSAQSQERTRLLRVNELAARFFESELKRSESAQRYIEGRGVSAELVARFRLGYAPDAWDGMLRLFAEKRVPHELAEQAGLLIRREGSQPLPARAPATSATHYDRFRDRIMFPLLVAGGGKAQTALGDVVAFGGRMMPSSGAAGSGKEQNPGAKYINSPETPIYKKGEHLFGLHSARDVIRKQRQVVLVEGNFDVIALQQHGFDNTVAPMGTALTETQVRLLGRLIGEDGHVVLMLDGDKAGRSATMKDIFLFTDSMLRGVTMLSGRNVDVRVARLPDGEDPDTFASRDPAALANVIRTAQPAVDYVLDELTAKAEHAGVAGRAKVLERIAPLLLGLPNETARAMYVDRVASALGVRPELLWSRLQAVGPAGQGQGQGQGQGSIQQQAQAPQRGMGAPRQPQPQSETPRPIAPRAPARRSPGDATELSLVALIGDHPRLLEHLQEEVLDSLENPVISELLRQAREEAEGGATISVEKLIELSPEEARPQVAAAAMAGTFLHSEHPEEQLTFISRTIRTRAIQREVRDLTQHLIRTQKAGDTAASQSIFQRIQDLNRLREKIGKGEMGDPSPCAQTKSPPDVTGEGTVEGDHPR